MWWVPLIAAAAIGVLALALHSLQQRRQVQGAKAYRRRFTQLIAQLELVTISVNQQALQLRRVKEPRLLDYYEGTLRILETLLGALRKIPPYGTDQSTLDAAVFLVKDCRQRVGRLAKGFDAVRRGAKPNLEEVYGGDYSPQGKTALKVVGCYFCSRPVVTERFAEVKVRLDGVVKDVISCKICREQLATTRKLKVLHFLHEGKPVHWSEMASYQPSEEFWGINRPGGAGEGDGAKGGPPRSRHLELVHSAPEAHHPKSGH